MGSFISDIFSSSVERAVTDTVTEGREKSKAKKEKKKTLLAAQQDEANKLQTQAQDRQKLLQIGASSQIATTSRGVLGEPTTGRRRLSI